MYGTFSTTKGLLMNIIIKMSMAYAEKKTKLTIIILIYHTLTLD